MRQPKQSIIYFDLEIFVIGFYTHPRNFGNRGLWTIHGWLNIFWSYGRVWRFFWRNHVPLAHHRSFGAAVSGWRVFGRWLVAVFTFISFICCGAGWEVPVDFWWTGFLFWCFWIITTACVVASLLVETGKFGVEECLWVVMEPRAQKIDIFFVETAAKELPKHTVREKWQYSGVGFA